MTQQELEGAIARIDDLQMTPWTRRQLLGRAIGLTAGLAIAPLAIACGGSPTSGPSANPNTTLGKAIASKSLRVGIFDGFPYSFVDANGMPTGASVETLLGALEPVGVKSLEPVVVDFSALIPGLLAGRFDAIAAGLYTTKARCPQVAFGNPDMQMGDGFIVRKGNPKNLHGYANLATSGATMGAGAGDSTVTTAKNAGVKDSQFQFYASNADGLAAVSAGRIDCWAASSASVANLMKHDPPANVERATPFTDPTDASGQPIKGHPAAAFRPADTDLRDAYNRGLDKLIQSGGLLKTLQKFGLTEGELPAKGVTTATICS